MATNRNTLAGKLSFAKKTPVKGEIQENREDQVTAENSQNAETHNSKLLLIGSPLKLKKSPNTLLLNTNKNSNDKSPISIVRTDNKNIQTQLEARTHELVDEETQKSSFLEKSLSQLLLATKENHQERSSISIAPTDSKLVLSTKYDNRQAQLEARIHELYYDEEKKDAVSNAIIDAIKKIEKACDNILKLPIESKAEKKAARKIQNKLSLLKEALLNEEFKEITAQHLAKNNKKNYELLRRFCDLLSQRKIALSNIQEKYQHLFQSTQVEGEEPGQYSDFYLKEALAGLAILVFALGCAFIGATLGSLLGPGAAFVGGTVGLGVGYLPYRFCGGRNAFFPPATTSIQEIPPNQNMVDMDGSIKTLVEALKISAPGSV